jgi:hypothetical protein
MSNFASFITMSQDEFNALTRVDKVVWSDESFSCLIAPVNDYFVSLIYSVVVDEAIEVSSVPEMDVFAIGITTDEANVSLPIISAGTIETTLSTSGANFLESVDIELPLMTADKEVTSSYAGASVSDSANVGFPVINSGSIAITASYVDHVIQTETINVSMPVISSGVKS